MLIAVPIIIPINPNPTTMSVRLGSLLLRGIVAGARVLNTGVSSSTRIFSLFALLS